MVAGIRLAFGVRRGRSRRADLGDSRRVIGAHGGVTGSWTHIHYPKNGVIADNADAERQTPNAKREATSEFR